MAEQKINPMIRNLLKGFIPTVKDKLPVVNDYITDYLAKIELTDDEERAVFMCFSDTDKMAWIVTATLSKNGDQLKRVINRIKAVDFIADMIVQF